jgi:hypothetical protein
MGPLNASYASNKLNLYSPPPTLLSASTTFFPYVPPGSCVSVLARSMGLVPNTAMQLATPASVSMERWSVEREEL